VSGELDLAVSVASPLQGEWLVERSPADRIPSHGTDLFGQRFAYDFIRVDQRRGRHVHPAGALRWYLVGGRTEDCYAWGQPVHAVVAGEVVAATDGVAEPGWVQPVREVWRALRGIRRFVRGRYEDVAGVAGNHVIVGRGRTYALYAHLAPGSVAVRAGQQVETGELLGRVGHTGISTSPHLHFQLMDAADPRRASGVPCAFEDYLVWRQGRWLRATRAIPHGGDRVRFEIPRR
jgi:Peptidase family M23